MFEISVEREVPPRRVHPRPTHRNGFERLKDRQFTTMVLAFRANGGVVSSEVMTECLRHVAPQPISRLARWIVSRTILTLPWNGQTFVPMFQFRPRDMSVRSSFTCVFEELRDPFDDWEAALWFATPNVWLNAKSPVECLDDDLVEVVQAARADCFIARG